MHGKVATLGDGDLQAFIGPGLAFVDFGAAWCPPCRRTDPFVEELAREFPTVRFARVDCDASPATAAAQGVLGMPTFLLLRDGRRVGQVVGGVPKQRLREALLEAGARPGLPG